MGVVPEGMWEDTTQLYRQKETVSGQAGSRSGLALLWVSRSHTLHSRPGLRVLFVPLALCGPKGLGCCLTSKLLLPGMLSLYLPHLLLNAP